MSAGQVQKLAQELKLTEILQFESVPLSHTVAFLFNFVYTEAKFSYNKNFHSNCKSVIKGLATH